MNCQESRRLMQAFVDQQLAPQDAQAVAGHLAGCPVCSAELKQLNSLRDAIRAQGVQHAAPEHLRRRIQLAVREQARPAIPRRANWKQRLRDLPWAWINLGLTSACALGLAAVLVLPPSAGSGEDQLAQELTDSHFRSLLVDHLADVASSDQHTVKPWFTGKLDFAPPVYDFAQQDYPLIGGRLDYADRRTVAALVYKHKRHVLNLFIWPAPGAAHTGVRHMSKQGYQLLHWSQAGMQYWLISDMNAADLNGFESLLAAQLDKDAAHSR
ncbi:anti-sigma factor [Undibacterium sp.]|jgi:anti-sigma factor (TIGR02949 family)|uniref:anti-sigma factor family protein n=1 Tax=Undibacterium sp. TaxID=1914977 RepID=UPI002C27F043|nr:anti-sigma factor [Undibacterium sp.]HTD05716.1 anti-sigma factor [Undibacterium sp.]